MLVDIRETLAAAQKGGYAVGAFNTVNLETTRAILDAAQETRSPIIIQMTEKTLDYAGGRALHRLVRDTAEFYYPEVPISIHLDHGKSFEIIERALEIGFGSVMYDGSRREYADNLAMTTKVVKTCHEQNVAVQAELGSVPYIGEVSFDADTVWEDYMTNPHQAKEFVEETGLDVLAVAIGNAHGFFRERSVPDYDRLKEIRKNVKVPLVLHGASDWDADRVREVVELGISCFNVDTATRVAFVGQMKQTLRESDELDLRKIFGEAKESVTNIIKEKIIAFGSNGKA